MSWSRWLMIALAFALVAGFTTIVSGGVPAGSEELELNHVDGKKGAVKFAHGKHTTEYKKDDGSAIVCRDCHHTLTEDAPADASSVKGCSTCHKSEGEAQVENAPFIAVKNGDKFDKKSIIFHKNCLDGCHKEYKAKKIKACKNCHK